MGILQTHISTLKLEESGCIESVEAAIEGLTDQGLEDLVGDDEPISVNHRIGHKLTFRLREDRKLGVAHPPLAFRCEKHGKFKDETPEDWYDMRRILDGTYDECIELLLSAVILADNGVTAFEATLNVWDGDLAEGYPTKFRGSVLFTVSANEFPQYFEFLPGPWRVAMRRRVERLAVELTEQHAATELTKSRYKVITKAISQL